MDSFLNNYNVQLPSFLFYKWVPIISTEIEGKKGKVRVDLGHR